MSVTVKADSIKALLDQLNAPKFQNKVGEVIVSGMKELIASGVSPVRGEPRFEGYKNQQKYPGKRKASRPVNLSLSGDMIEALDYTTRGGSLVIGITDFEQALKATTHQEGLNGVPQRRFIPDQNGEELAVTIQRDVEAVYNDAIADIINSTK